MKMAFGRAMIGIMKTKVLASRTECLTDKIQRLRGVLSLLLSKVVQEFRTRIKRMFV